MSAEDNPYRSGFLNVVSLEQAQELSILTETHIILGIRNSDTTPYNLLVVHRHRDSSIDHRTYFVELDVNGHDVNSLDDSCGSSYIQAITPFMG